MKRRPWKSAAKICGTLFMPISGAHKILGFLINAAIRMPRLVIAVALLALAALASALTFTGFLVVGVVADYLGTGRIVAGLLLGVVFARFPWISKGKLRIAGLLPPPLRRPLVLALLVLSSVHFLSQGAYAPAVFTGFATAFVLGYPWLRRSMRDRMVSSFARFTGRQPPGSADDMVIDGEIRERKE
jgi:hypothetical protein